MSLFASALRPLRAPSAVLAAAARRPFGLSPLRQSFHFDTQAFIERLEHEGLSRQQATGVMGALAEVRPGARPVSAVWPRETDRAASYRRWLTRA